MGLMSLLDSSMVLLMTVMAENKLKTNEEQEKKIFLEPPFTIKKIRLF
jgi:hypothetical protein